MRLTEEESYSYRQERLFSLKRVTRNRVGTFMPPNSDFLSAMRRYDQSKLQEATCPQVPDE